MPDGLCIWGVWPSSLASMPGAQWPPLRRQVRFCLLLLLSCPLLPTCARRCLCNGDLWFACLPVSNDHLESFSRFGLPVRVLRDSGGLSLDCRWTGCGWTMGAWLAKFNEVQLKFGEVQLKFSEVQCRLWVCWLWLDYRGMVGEVQ